MTGEPTESPAVLSEPEKAFCRAFVLSGGNDPIGAYLQAFTDATIDDDGLGRTVAALCEREDVRLEVYYLGRLANELAIGSLLIELEQARRAALAQDNPALAAWITGDKAVLMGHAVREPLTVSEGFCPDAEQLTEAAPPERNTVH